MINFDAVDFSEYCSQEVMFLSYAQWGGGGGIPVTIFQMPIFGQTPNLFCMSVVSVDYGARDISGWGLWKMRVIANIKP